MDEKIAGFELNDQSGSDLINFIPFWKKKADEYYRASEYLFTVIENELTELSAATHEEIVARMNTSEMNKPDISNPYFFLVCISIENLLKGIILFKKPSLLQNKLDQSVKTHNLTYLSSLVEIEYQQDEKEFFEMATTIIEWFGRYPIPTKPGKQVKHAHFDYSKIRNAYLTLFLKLTIYMETHCGVFPQYYSSERLR